MNKIIQYLTKNPEVITMLQKEKICLVGLDSEIERKALVDVLNKVSSLNIDYWK